MINLMKRHPYALLLIEALIVLLALALFMRPMAARGALRLQMPVPYNMVLPPITIGVQGVILDGTSTVATTSKGITK